jgi:L-ornithine N5-oxygenase
MEPYDLVGIGFGPSNLAVAVAAAESATPIRSIFFDRKEAFAWHPGLMFDGAEMQVSFLKDLVTQRNPRSWYSFLNYLTERGRLPDFVNLRSFYPTRVEFNDYYAWVAEQFRESVRWNSEVVSVMPELAPETGEIRHLVVTIQDAATGEQQTVLTRNLIIAPGGEPKVPTGVELGARVFHASTTRDVLASKFSDASAPYHFNIVGGGQTAADVFIHLRRAYPHAKITTSIRGFAIQAEDDTHFVNELFFPEMPDWFFTRDPDFRSQLLQRYSLAAHTGVSYDLIPQIYREYYEDKVSGADLLRMMRFAELAATSETAQAVSATYRDLEGGPDTIIESDAVILATGYDYPMPIPTLAGCQKFLRLNQDSSYTVLRNYAIETDPSFRPRVFLQGFSEQTHGFSEVLLSLMPFRAAEIVASLQTDELLAGAR